MRGITLLGMPDTIGDRVRRLRIERGLSQEKLAAKAETSVSTVTRLERNKIVSDTKTLIRIAAVLGVTPAELHGDDVSPSRCERYPSLEAFLSEHAERMRISEQEEGWMASQVFSDDGRDIGDAMWWMAQLMLFRQQLRASVGAHMLITATPDPRAKG